MTPYTLEEIENFEKKFSDTHNIPNFKLPNQLRAYLLEISRCFNLYSYPIVFDLRVYQKDTEEDEYKNEYPQEMRDDSLVYEVGDGGCSFSYQMNIISGNMYYCDGDNFMIINKSFNELITDRSRFRGKLF